MKVGKNFKIESDKMNVTLYRWKTDKKGESYWSPQGYYATVKNALNGLVDQGVRDTELRDFKEVCKKVDELKADIARLEIKGG